MNGIITLHPERIKYIINSAATIYKPFTFQDFYSISVGIIIIRLTKPFICKYLLYKTFSKHSEFINTSIRIII